MIFSQYYKHKTIDKLPQPEVKQSPGKHQISCASKVVDFARKGIHVYTITNGHKLNVGDPSNNAIKSLKPTKVVKRHILPSKVKHSPFHTCDKHQDPQKGFLSLYKLLE